MSGSPKPRLAVHRFSSCGGCRLALIDLGEPLLGLADLLEIVHFPELGRTDEAAEVDIALVEGSVSTAADIERLAALRGRSRILIALGACATSGGIQALLNLHAPADPMSDPAAATPPRIDPITDHVRTDWQLWGCPVDTTTLVTLLRDLATGLRPRPTSETLCLECKRRGAVCVLVSRREPCMGPVTAAGCGALCPRLGRACYGCFGPAGQVHSSALPQNNTHSLRVRFAELGRSEADIRNRFQLIHANAPAFRQVTPPSSGERA